MPIKVLHFITGIDIGGAETLLFTTVKGLDKKKIDVKVCYLKGMVYCAMISKPLG